MKNIYSQNEIEVVLRNEFVGNIVLFERMENTEVLKKKEQNFKILLLVFYGSNVKLWEKKEYMECVNKRNLYSI